jgi:IclR family acetate operon transcriptional repressor
MATSRDDQPAAANYQVRALERALDIVGAFTLAEPELTLTAIAARVGLAKSTATRLLAVLEERGWLERSAATDRYRIGVRAFEIGNIYIQTTTLESEAQPILRHLATTCQQTANLGILRQGEVVHIAVVAPDRPIRFSTPVGLRDSAHLTGLGKALLAALPGDELAAVIARHGLPGRTARTITTPEALRANLAEIRSRGYALDDEEAFDGLRCIAAPIRDARGETIAAVSISGLASEFNESALPRYIAAVQDAARAISARLGNGVQVALAAGG